MVCLPPQASRTALLGRACLLLERGWKERVECAVAEPTSRPLCWSRGYGAREEDGGSRAELGRHHGVPRSPPMAGLGMTRQPACLDPDRMRIGRAVQVPHGVRRSRTGANETKTPRSRGVPLGALARNLLVVKRTCPVLRPAAGSVSSAGLHGAWNHCGHCQQGLRVGGPCA